MALQHFFLHNQIIEEETERVFPLRLVSEDIKHARVLRLTPHEHIAIIDATQTYYECEITSFDGDCLMAKIAQKIESEPDLPTVVLVQAIVKGEKMGDIIRHATELGVGGFIPFMSERSIVKLDEKKAETKRQRWQSIARSAAMQSGRREIPEVSLPMNLAEVCEFISNATTVLVCWEEAETNSIHQAIEKALGKQRIDPRDARIAIVVGPEGGFTHHEATSLCAANRFGSLVSLGPSILRAETAGIVAPALVLYDLGVLQ